MVSNVLKKKLIFTVKLVVFFACTSYVWIQVKDKEEAWFDLFYYIHFLGYEEWIWVLILVPINLGLEALKWQFISNRFTSVDFSDSYRGVLAGMALGFISPRAFGDYAARIYFLPGDFRKEAVGGVFLSRIAQFFITFFYGVVAYMVMYRFTGIKSNFFSVEILILLSGCIFLIGLLITQFRFFWGKVRHLPGMKYIFPYIKLLLMLEWREFLVILFLSLCRYFVFLLQFILVFEWLGIPGWDIVVISGIALVFLAKSIFPSFNFLSDLGVREAAFLFFFANCGYNEYLLLLGSLSIWAVNVLTPTIIGAFIIFTRKP